MDHRALQLAIKDATGCLPPGILSSNGRLLQILSLVIAGATAWGVHTSTLRHLELLRNEDRQRIEARIDGQHGTPDDWRKSAEEWRALGATHISVTTARGGLEGRLQLHVAGTEQRQLRALGHQRLGDRPFANGRRAVGNGCHGDLAVGEHGLLDGPAVSLQAVVRDQHLWAFDGVHPGQ